MDTSVKGNYENVKDSSHPGNIAGVYGHMQGMIETCICWLIP